MDVKPGDVIDGARLEMSYDGNRWMPSGATYYRLLPEPGAAPAPRCPTCGEVGSQTEEQHERHPNRWFCAVCLEWWDESRRKPCKECAWKQDRLDALQAAQKRMRDPERTMVCDILANGKLLVPDGDRYAVPPCLTCQRIAAQTVDAVKAAEARCAELERERDAAKDERAKWQRAADQLEADANEHRRRCAELAQEAVRLRAEVEGLTAEKDAHRIARDRYRSRCERALEYMHDAALAKFDLGRAADILRGEGDET